MRKTCPSGAQGMLRGSLILCILSLTLPIWAEENCAGVQFAIDLPYKIPFTTAKLTVTSQGKILQRPEIAETAARCENEFKEFQATKRWRTLSEGQTDDVLSDINKAREAKGLAPYTRRVLGSDRLVAKNEKSLHEAAKNCDAPSAGNDSAQNCLRAKRLLEENTAACHHASIATKIGLDQVPQFVPTEVSCSKQKGTTIHIELYFPKNRSTGQLILQTSADGIAQKVEVQQATKTLRTYDFQGQRRDETKVEQDPDEDSPFTYRKTPHKDESDVLMLTEKMAQLCTPQDYEVTKQAFRDCAHQATLQTIGSITQRSKSQKSQQ